MVMSSQLPTFCCMLILSASVLPFFAPPIFWKTISSLTYINSTRKFCIGSFLSHISESVEFGVLDFSVSNSFVSCIISMSTSNSTTSLFSSAILVLMPSAFHCSPLMFLFFPLFLGPAPSMAKSFGMEFDPGGGVSSHLSHCHASFLSGLAGHLL